MANRFYDHERYGRDSEEEEQRHRRGTDYGRSGQEYSGSESYFRGSGSSYNDPYRSYGSSYNEPNRNYGNSYNDQNRNYGGSDYGRSEYGGRYGESYGRGYEERNSNPYYQNRRYRGFNRGWEDQGGEERGFLERAGDEVRSWFGDEEAERRRHQDEVRSQYAGRGPKGYKRSDERIREDVNDRLTGDYYLDAHDIEVSVNDCTVTLSGRVNSRNDKRRAEDLAESVRGVSDVSNQLRVGQDTSVTTTGIETTNVNRVKAARP
jgi:osmotically-inducible protein OsmY